MPPITEPYELDGVTVGVTPISLVSGTTTVNATVVTGVFQFWLDLSPMAKGDEFLFVISERVEATGGIRRTVLEQRFLGVQAEVWASPVLILRNGWNATLERVAGTDRAFDASVRQIS